MKVLLRVAIQGCLVGLGFLGCQSTSGGGSQTNWIHCASSAECKSDEICDDEHCVSREAQADGGVGTATSAIVRTSCVDRLDGFWGQCLAYESECQGDTATLRVVRTAICTDDGHALLSCTGVDGKRIQVAADITAFGGELPVLTTCACDPKTGAALDADLKASDDWLIEEQVFGCRTDGVSVNEAVGWGIPNDWDGGAPNTYGGPRGIDTRSTCPVWFGTAMGRCMSFDTCFNRCTTSAECPSPESGDPIVECASVVEGLAALGNTCLLHCAGDHACPDGMACVHGSHMGDVCLWQNRETMAGCP